MKLHKKTLVTGVVVATLVISGGSASAFSLFGHEFGQNSSANSTSNPASSTTDNNPCLHYTNHVYEVCTAYIANSSLAVLTPYYKYVHSNDSTLARYVNYRLGSRYVGQANTFMHNRVANWPKGSNDVSLPSIKILAASSSLKTNTAILHTAESWRVTHNGTVLLSQHQKHYTITLHRVPSYLLHKWVVTDIKQN